MLATRFVGAGKAGSSNFYRSTVNCGIMTVFFGVVVAEVSDEGDIMSM